MAESRNPLLNQILALWNRLSSTQKIVIISVVVSSVVGLVLLVSWANRPSFAVLYSQLSSEDAGAIVEKLKAQNIPYEIGHGGTAILVPANQADELRLQLAIDGLPRSGEIGYEIFDKTNLGMSEFLQKLNYRRALEGELKRTIESLSEIRQARVHIVIPEPSLYLDEEKPTTASVMLKLAPGSQLSKRQIKGITHLVAASVEGLRPENVTLVDYYGNPLTTPAEPGSLPGLNETQLTIKKNVEAYLTTKAQSLLDGVLGKNNAMVQIDADLDFTQIERTSEIFDPDNPAIRSEERTTSKAMTEGNPDSKSDHAITNYELNKKVERLIQSAGNIRGLTVAVMVNQKRVSTMDSTGEEKVTHEPRTPQELQELAAVIQNAVGLNEARGDRIHVSNLVFDQTELEQANQLLDQEERRQFWISVIQKAALAAGILLGLLLLRAIVKNLSFENLQAKINPEVEEITDKENKVEEVVTLKPLDETIDPKRLLTIQMEEQISQYSLKKPEEVARLLKTLMLEEKTGHAEPQL
jgi:flagellar M-ring protein FliF